MLQVESFLGCMKLETGGIIMGWLQLVGNALTFILCVVGVIVLGINDCNDFKEMMEKVFSTVPGADFDEVCSVGQGILIAVVIIVAVLSVGCAVIGFLCIKGTENRDHVRVKPMMILLAVVIVLSFLNILLGNIVIGLFYGFFYGYLFIVIYSLFIKFREEHERGFTTTQYQATGAKV